MSTPRSTGLQAVFEARAEVLAKASKLFEAGPLGNATSDSGYALRLNAHVFARGRQPDRRSMDLADAISTAGTLNEWAELVAFGRWLLIEGRPGLGAKPGLSSLI